MEFSPLASLLKPPLTLELNALATLSWPPLTLADGPLIVFWLPATKPPTLL